MNDNQDELKRVFGFEADFASGLRCIPMAVRYKLDLAGVKVSLKDWVKLTAEERQALLAQPCSSADQVRAFGTRTIETIASRVGHDPQPLPPVDASIWTEPGEPPSSVRELAACEGIVISTDAWARLSALQRFALVKLSRPSHKNESFRPALREFGFGG